MNRTIQTLLLVPFLLWFDAANAHPLSTAQLQLNHDEQGQINGQWSVALKDLEHVVGLDRDGDRELYWYEIKQAVPQILDYINQHLYLKSNLECPIRWSATPKLQQRYGEVLLQLPMQASCNTSQPISLHYTAMFSQINSHKLLVSWQSPSKLQQGIIDPSNQQMQLETESLSSWQNFSFFLQQGVVHIWIGLDHILFILTLILPVAGYHHLKTKHVLVKVAPGQARQLLAFKQVAWLITGFTLAHSVTLSMTALGWISLPSSWVEAGIAVSIIIAALNLVFNWIKNMGKLSFWFGLLHGMGFAGALAELGIPEQFQVSTILAFNLGVEIGQLVILGCLFPLVWWLRQTVKVKAVVIPSSAACLSLMGSYWFLQRLAII